MGSKKTMTVAELVDMVAAANCKTLTDRERQHLIRMIERAAVRGASVDLLIEECRALLA